MAKIAIALLIALAIAGCGRREDDVSKWPKPPTNIAVSTPTAPPVAPATGTKKTYTASQLRQMVDSGAYPKQGEAVTQSAETDFDSCSGKVQALLLSVADYPARTVLSTNAARIEKVWTNDGAITLSCSAKDRKLVVTTAPYL